MYGQGVRPEPVLYGDRKVYAVSAFNRGVGQWLRRLPSVWVEGEVTELRRQSGWQSVFFTLKDPEDGSCLPVTMPRGGFDGLRLDLADGARVHVFGRPELYEARGQFKLRALSIEPVGLGDVLARLERLKAKLAAEGMFEAARKRPLPRFPRRIGLLTGNEAAAKRDFVTAVRARFPAANLVVAQTYVQGPQAAAAVAATLARLAGEPELDVIVLARGGGSFEDLLPFSDERVVRAVASCRVAGRERRRPRAGHAALRSRGRRPRLDAYRGRAPRRSGRARAPGAARHACTCRSPGRADERWPAPATGSTPNTRGWAGRPVSSSSADAQRSSRRPAGSAPSRLTRPSPAATRSCAGRDGIVRAAAAIEPGQRVDVRVAQGSFGARVEDLHP